MLTKDGRSNGVPDGALIVWYDDELERHEETIGPDGLYPRLEARLAELKAAGIQPRHGWIHNPYHD